MATPLAPASLDRNASVRARRARPGPPAPLAEGAQTDCPIAGAPAGSRAPNGSAPNSLPSADLAEARLNPRTQGTRGNVVFSDGATCAPEERLVSHFVPWSPTVGPSTRVESSFGCGAPHRFAGFTGRLIEGASGRVQRRPRAEPPAGGRRGEMRRKGTCEPNLSKSTRASRRRPRTRNTGVA